MLKQKLIIIVKPRLPSAQLRFNRPFKGRLQDMKLKLTLR